jgi:hypothetical protein
MAICVDDGGVEIAGNAEVLEVVEVYVAVDEITRPERAHEPEEGREAAVAGIVLVVDSRGGRVGHEDVEKPAVQDAVEDEPGDEREKATLHLPVRILVESVVVLKRTGDSRDEKIALANALETDVRRPVASPGIEAIVGANVAFGRYAVDPVIQPEFRKIVVSENEIDGFIQRRNDKIEVFHRKVSGGNDEIDILIALLNVAAVD